MPPKHSAPVCARVQGQVRLSSLQIDTNGKSMFQEDRWLGEDGRFVVS